MDTSQELADEGGAKNGDWLLVVWRSDGRVEVSAVSRHATTEQVTAHAVQLAGSHASFAISKLGSPASNLTPVNLGPEVPALPEQLRREWKEDIERLKVELAELCDFDDTYAQVAAILPQNLGRMDVFPDWLFKAYSSELTSGVRRQLDADARSHSLRVLFKRVSERPDVLSREYYVETFMSHETDPDPAIRALVRRDAEQNFDALAGPGERYVPREVLDGHRKRIRTAGKRVVAYVNDHVAHADRSPAPDEDVPDVFETRQALQSLYTALRFLDSCINAGTWSSPMFFAKSKAWTTLFRRAWIPDGTDLPHYEPLYDASGRPTDYDQLRRFYDGPSGRPDGSVGDSPPACTDES
jgi:hypothetical protein